MGMGARVADIVTEVERNDDGSVRVVVAWRKDETANEAATGQAV
jgi:hypothetical protein